MFTTACAFAAVLLLWWEYIMVKNLLTMTKKGEDDPYVAMFVYVAMLVFAFPTVMMIGYVFGMVKA